ncbi:PREDICTED: adhesive plaque matrix protein 2-like [Branchiostoma belcheri]|uniref:Adhesive plaque matrix protein 2-like n=1 Tax=Branchiostoma belcheri TaxID=7741 RepID=A0A6P5AWT9_BRABE|nr:PREDICTED: adhesive plaque matrix protein 2-like [Branchiostoma belcheri]
MNTMASTWTLAVLLLLGTVCLSLAAPRENDTKNPCKGDQEEKVWKGCRVAEGRKYCECGKVTACDNPYKFKSDRECMKDLFSDVCNPNPCKNGGRCSQKGKQYACLCSNTGFYGRRCHKACPEPGSMLMMSPRFPVDCIHVG